MEPLPLHLCKPYKLSSILNRLYSLIHVTALTSLIYYRVSSLASTPLASLPAQLLVFALELLLSLLWLLNQAYLWNPVSRRVFPERLPENEQNLPAIDVFICTADPKKEPPLEVMNTVLSAMALDYPSKKLHVYLSDDAGSALTLLALRQACAFASSWLPFCRRFGIKTRCPKRKYELFKEHIRIAEEEKSSATDKINPSIVEVIIDKSDDEVRTNQVEMPLLVYVSREKRPPHPHHFKAGALNCLLRVSSILSNSPYILVLDCDMYCNDPTSAKQAMCFHLDPKLSPSLAFVQFPQKFHNISSNDIYDSQLRTTFQVRWPGMDGIQGPMLSGTCFYMKREALYGIFLQKELHHLKESFGPSNELIISLQRSNQRKTIGNGTLSSTLQQEAQFLASYNYETNTLWGKQARWKSVFCNPSRSAFLGSATSSLNDTLVQGTRWNCGLLEVTFSKCSPPLYGLSRMPLLQTMCYSYYALQPFYSLPLWCLASVPQLCLINGISLYPKVSSPWFVIFSSIFLCSLLKHLVDVLVTGGSVQTWCNEQRIWMIKSLTCYTYGTIDAILKCFGMKQPCFSPTNKVSDDEQAKLHQLGMAWRKDTGLVPASVALLSFVLSIIFLLLGSVVLSSKFGSGDFGNGSGGDGHGGVGHSGGDGHSGGGGHSDGDEGNVGGDDGNGSGDGRGGHASDGSGGGGGAVAAAAAATAAMAAMATAATMAIMTATTATTATTMTAATATTAVTMTAAAAMTASAYMAAAEDT
ncbi:cellulose synthase-like protein G2 [Citrus sinensis]|uniref:Cellulose synthase-like protein G2 n=1 Tax=Citrus sinensis TaxID=2711 RepID=A0ACB8I568_CITSI|nr:cellulose synthase-like protein G2 [Citrus sinensis]